MKIIIIKKRMLEDVLFENADPFPSEYKVISDHEELEDLVPHNNFQFENLDNLECEYSILRLISNDIIYDKVVPSTRDQNEISKLLLPKLGNQLRPYQLEAIESVEKNGFNGILEMATGTGKTFTAIKLIERILEKDPISSLFIIVTPLLDLNEGWKDEIYKNLGVNSTVCDSRNSNWKKNFAAKITFSPNRKCSILIVTGKTFSTVSFQEKIKNESNRITLIYDEVHNFKSESSQKNNYIDFRNKIALSATPLDDYDKGIIIYNERDRKLLKYFKGIAFKYDLGQAITAGYLCKYVYNYHNVYLTLEETDEYDKAVKAIAALMAKQATRPLSLDERNYLNMMIGVKNRILGTCGDKKIMLTKLLMDIDELKNTIVYCPTGYFSNNGLMHESIEDEEKVDSLMTTNLESIYQLMIKIFNMKNKNPEIVRFTSEDKNRTIILNEFKSGIIDVLLAMRCLDEGIDVPSVSTVYIMESLTSTRQHIQRRGRILRTFPGKKLAYINDFIVHDHFGNVIESEEKRRIEFERLAENE